MLSSTMETVDICIYCGRQLKETEVYFLSDHCAECEYQHQPKQEEARQAGYKAGRQAAEQSRQQAAEQAGSRITRQQAAAANNQAAAFNNLILARQAAEQAAYKPDLWLCCEQAISANAQWDFSRIAARHFLDRAEIVYKAAINWSNTIAEQAEQAEQAGRQQAGRQQQQSRQQAEQAAAAEYDRKTKAKYL
jgi:hypothetical protein